MFRRSELTKASVQKKKPEDPILLKKKKNLRDCERKMSWSRKARSPQ